MMVQSWICQQCYIQQFTLFTGFPSRACRRLEPTAYLASGKSQSTSWMSPCTLTFTSVAKPCREATVLTTAPKKHIQRSKMKTIFLFNSLTLAPPPLRPMFLNSGIHSFLHLHQGLSHLTQRWGSSRMSH